MNQAMITSTIRHLITGYGAVLVNQGYTDNSTLELISGGIAAAIGLAWSYYTKRKTA